MKRDRYETKCGRKRKSSIVRKRKDYRAKIATAMSFEKEKAYFNKTRSAIANVG